MRQKRGMNDVRKKRGPEKIKKKRKIRKECDEEGKQEASSGIGCSPPPPPLLPVLSI